MSTILTALAVLAAAAPGLLVSPAELAASLKDPATVVIFVDSNEANFVAGHIPDARFVSYDQIAIDADGLSSELPPVDQLRKVLGAVGISDKSKVVIYGAAIPAARMFFTLDYLGHPNAKLLNGGLNAWKASGGAIEIGEPKQAAIATLTPRPQPVACGVRRLDQGTLVIAKDDAPRRAARCRVHRRRRRHGRRARQGPLAGGPSWSGTRCSTPAASFFPTPSCEKNSRRSAPTRPHRL